MTIYDIIVTLVILAFAIFAVILIRNRKKKGRGCNGNCAQCDKCK